MDCHHVVILQVRVFKISKIRTTSKKRWLCILSRYFKALLLADVYIIQVCFCSLSRVPTYLVNDLYVQCSRMDSR